MAHDDRDRNFEKALAHQLRYIAPSVPEAGLPAGASLQLCPDPEILAAYHEQSLSSDELSFWKPHVVTCSHCQFVLAELTATDNIALEVAPAKDPLLLSEPAPSSKERPRDSRFLNRERRPPSWRWVLLLPAGAIAASLVAWVSLRNSIPPPRFDRALGSNGRKSASSAIALSTETRSSRSERPERKGAICFAHCRSCRRRHLAEPRCHRQPVSARSTAISRSSESAHSPSPSWPLRWHSTATAPTNFAPSSRRAHR